MEMYMYMHKDPKIGMYGKKKREHEWICFCRQTFITLPPRNHNTFALSFLIKDWSPPSLAASVCPLRWVAGSMCTSTPPAPALVFRLSLSFIAKVLERVVCAAVPVLTSPQFPRQDPGVCSPQLERACRRSSLQWRYLTISVEATLSLDFKSKIW